MKERPILFNGAMVRAILSGAKTQTRCVIKHQPESHHWAAGTSMPGYQLLHTAAIINDCSAVRFRHQIPQNPQADHDRNWNVCPYGRPGVRLWVRETWADLTATHGRHWEKYNAATGLYERGIHPFLWYAADGDQPEMGGGEINREPWRPSTSMPRSACRLVLEITDVRVERLQAITDADALAEGVDRTNTSIPGYAKQRFHHLWASTGGNWDANPWVWVIGFKVIDQQAKPEVGNG